VRSRACRRSSEPVSALEKGKIAILPLKLPQDILAILGRISVQRPRVQCLTNTVAQNLTANVLLAIGADVSMAQHPAEILAMSASAQALLLNLGTLDLAREAAINALLDNPPAAIPIVIDPVFADRSPIRLALARRLLALDGAILKGNAAEMAALASYLTDSMTHITTGATDVIQGPTGRRTVSDGHPIMTRVTATGCVAGAMIAAFAAVEPDKVNAATAALTCFGMAGNLAAQRSAGPGSFPAHLIDVLAECADTAMTQNGQEP
jgi:hydroxyethylthiazole kinase